MEKRLLLPTAGTSLTLAATGLMTVTIVSVGHLNMNSVVFGGVVLLLAASLILATVAWVGGLMLAARLQRWDWLVGVLVLGPLGALLFCLVPGHEPIQHRSFVSLLCLPWGRRACRILVDRLVGLLHRLS